MLRYAMRVGGESNFQKKCSEGVRFNVITATRGVGGWVSNLLKKALRNKEETTQ